MNWEQSLLSIIAAAIIITLLKVSIERIIYFFKTGKTEIPLNIPEAVLDTGTKFGLLYVKDGKTGKLINKIRRFKKVDQQGNLKISIRYPRNLGFQFKCFADFKGISFKQLKKTLEGNTYQHVSKSTAKTDRIWFIHPDYSTFKTVDGIENNFFFPE
jgi:hypothetical protein